MPHLESGDAQGQSHDESRRLAYSQLCASYHAIDAFRTNLLGLLPTGTGAFLVIPELMKGSQGATGVGQSLVQMLSPAIGVFGFVITLGFFFFELYGIRKCTYLIEVGKDIERKLGVQGQFLHRADGLFGFVAEPFASGVIYPATLAAWTSIALYDLRSGPRVGWSVGVFLVFLAISLRFIQWLKRDAMRLEDALKAAT